MSCKEAHDSRGKECAAQIGQPKGLHRSIHEESQYGVSSPAQAASRDGQRAYDTSQVRLRAVSSSFYWSSDRFESDIASPLAALTYVYATSVSLVERKVSAPMAPEIAICNVPNVLHTVSCCPCYYWPSACGKPYYWPR